jgi:hypothetical protein
MSTPVGLILVAAAFAFGGVEWELVAEGQAFADPASGYSIQYPTGWRWYRQSKKNPSTLATRDGAALQNISVEFRSHKDAFPALKQKAQPDMLPHEFAEKVVAEESAYHQNVEILSNEPTIVGGRPGFRIDLTHRVTTGAASLRYREVVLGTNVPQGVFIVHYRATVLHHFDRDLDAFERALGTLVIEERTN